MTTEQTAQQLELAAQILRTGHPFMVSPKPNGLWCVPTLSEMNILKWPVVEYEIRPILATPPDNRPLHNPDNLTAEQVGVGYRLLLKDELACSPLDFWYPSKNGWKKSVFETGDEIPVGTTYRTTLSVPWPESQPDPYAELKKAHAEGKVIQWHDGITWIDHILPSYENPIWMQPVKDYRIKPEPTIQLPPPPPGMQWHRTDRWQEGDLPQGWRPLIEGEYPMKEDECIAKIFESEWRASHNCMDGSGTSEVCHYRTRRPLIFTHAGKQWTWHRPGDPCPCDSNAKICVLTVDGDHNSDEDACYARVYAFGDLTESGLKGAEIIGWRYADEKTVPLGPEDVPPGSVFRPVGWSGMPNAYVNYEAVVTNGVRTIGREWGDFCSEYGYLPWAELKNDWQINRSLPLTGKWNPDAWEPCHKLSSKNG